MSKHLFSDIRIPIEENNPSIIRHEDLCIKCGQCRRVCEEAIGVGRLYDLISTGDTAVCIHCGQCANVCPVNSITEKYEYPQVREAILDPEKVVIFNTSPSVRVGLGEAFGLPAGSFVEGSMVAALRALGADYVLDTNFSADLTIMEEATELVSRIAGKEKPLPQFTSCCPAWVKFVETFYPSFIPNLSSAKSPIGMQGPTVKTYFAAKHGIDPKRIVNVAVTPCTAKKFEIRRPELPGMDCVITTRELAQWMREDGVDFASLNPSAYDSLMGPASGAGVIFGNTGGVMEAAVRTAYFLITGENPPADLVSLSAVRGMDGIREASLTIGEIPVRVAVVHGTENARQLLRRLEDGHSADYDFIEVMTCRGGCIGGGGQPKTTIPPSDDTLSSRIAALYTKDEASAVRFSHENPDILQVYKDYYGEPGSELAEEQLHTVYSSRGADLGPAGMVEKPLTYQNQDTPASPPPKDVSASSSAEGAADSGNSGAVKQWRCSICGYIYEGEELPADFVCPLCGMPAELFEPVE